MHEMTVDERIILKRILILKINNNKAVVLPVYTVELVYKEHRRDQQNLILFTYSETWELGTPKGLSKTVLNSEIVLFLRSISM